MNGITHSSRVALVTSASTVTRTTLARRAASPAAKSEPPYPAAAASANKTASIGQVLPLRPGQRDSKSSPTANLYRIAPVRDGRCRGDRRYRACCARAGALRGGLARRRLVPGGRLAKRRLVGERDRELAGRRGVERRRRAQALHVRLGGAQLVPGEVGLR
jgi:hypothetical protein